MHQRVTSETNVTAQDWAEMKRLYDANGADRMVDMLLALAMNDHKTPEWLEDGLLELAKRIDKEYGHHRG
jgi:hypothetical protein